MVQMTKQEIIKYFLEQLGDNKVLEKWISKEEIQNILNQTIKEITYEKQEATDENQEIAEIGNWDKIGTVYFNIEEINKSTDVQKVTQYVIVHELLHVIFTYLKNNKAQNNDGVIKCGLEYEPYTILENGEKLYYGAENSALNEGMTDWLTEEIIEYEIGSYPFEKKICKTLSKVIGKETMIEKYCSDDFSSNPRDIFLEECIKRYGKEAGVQINEKIKRILRLADKKIDFSKSHEISKQYSDKTTLINLIEKEINNTLEMIMKKSQNCYVDKNGNSIYKEQIYVEMDGKDIELYNKDMKLIKGKKYKKLSKKISDVNNQSEYAQNLETIEIAGNNVKLFYFILDENQDYKRISVDYFIDEDGNLELTNEEKGEEEKISKISSEIQEQTQDVSISEMMREANNVSQILKRI